MELENTLLVISPTLDQWGSLGPLIVYSSATLHLGLTRFVRLKSTLSVFPNLEFGESFTFCCNAKYIAFLKCESSFGGPGVLSPGSLELLSLHVLALFYLLLQLSHSLVCAIFVRMLLQLYSVLMFVQFSAGGPG